MPVENLADLIDTLDWARRDLYLLAFRLSEGDQREILMVNARLMRVSDNLAQHLHQAGHTDPRPSPQP